MQLLLSDHILSSQNTRSDGCVYSKFSLFSFYLIPNLKAIKIYFEQQNFPELEAQKFFNYFSSNGWLGGGKTPMIDWTASAQNGMLKANKFNPKETTNKAKHLNTSTDKDYSEPL
jgi:hypothetical protein